MRAAYLLVDQQGKPSNYVLHPDTGLFLLQCQPLAFQPDFQHENPEPESDFSDFQKSFMRIIKTPLGPR